MLDDRLIVVAFEDMSFEVLHGGLLDADKRGFRRWYQDRVMIIAPNEPIGGGQGGEGNVATMRVSSRLGCLQRLDLEVVERDVDTGFIRESACGQAHIADQDVRVFDGVDDGAVDDPS